MSFALLILLSAAAAPPAPPADPQFTSSSAFGTTAPVDTPSLNQATAREDLSQVAVSQQTSTVSHNSVNGTSVTGGITFDGNAFQNVRGLSVISANSGNNVSINSSLTVNLSFTPAP